MDARLPLVVSLAFAVGAALASCGDSGGTGGDGGSGAAHATGSSTAAQGASSGETTTGAFSSGASMGPFGDFPADPIIDGTAPANAPSLFGPAGSGSPTGGPCMTEPEVGSLFPNNWLRPRFRFSPASGENLFEIRLHAASQINDLVVYTTNTSWTMPKDVWTALAAHSVDDPIEVTIRGAVFDGTALTGDPAVGSDGPITIAPASAAGNIVYWTTSGGSALKGFKVGDESVVAALAPAQVQMPTSGGQVTCVGCHTSTPDGLFASFVAQGPWSNAIASIQGTNTGTQPPFLGAGALAFLDSGQPMGIHTYSQAHWQSGDHTMVTPVGDYANSKLYWVDLEAGGAPAAGEIARQGDTQGVGAPAWTHDGSTIVYVSTTAELTGRLDNGPADLYSVPYNNRMGGAATPIAGASDASFEEYYPALSPDDRFIAFNRIPSGNNMYDQPAAELFVLPFGGGTPVRLAANDPPACTGASSPGITNSWPKWAPSAGSSGGKTYYWLVFSSRRNGGNPQLFITSVVVGADATITSYPSIYLWNQPDAESNHTPAWDLFDIPDVPQ
jgi:hypothetical protein